MSESVVRVIARRRYSAYDERQTAAEVSAERERAMRGKRHAEECARDIRAATRERGDSASC